MSNKKATFITIIVLLIIFLPLTILGFFANKNINPLDDNPKRDFFYDGYLWFYDENDNFLSKYECATEICELTNTTINDEEYGLNYYKDGNLTNIPILDYQYAFITDGVLIHLYNVQTGTILESYKSVKDYHTMLENSAFIIQNSNDVWGVLSIGKNLGSILPFEYDFIGLINNVSLNNTLETSNYVVLKDGNWYIVDNTNSAISGYIKDPIVDYTNDYIISKNGEKVRIFSYDVNEYFLDYNINDYIRLNNYLGIISNNTLYVFNDINSNYLKSIPLTNTSWKLKFQLEGNNLNILANDSVIDSIAL